MSTALDDARAGRAWSLTGLFHALDDVLDDEGRPMGERRASSAVKANVEIELKACPYGDHRRGQAMNVSALKQVMTHWDATIADIAALQGALAPAITGWLRMQCVVVDLLSRPAVSLLRGSGARVPVPLAVAYKLAAGYFSVLINLGPADAPAPGQSHADRFAQIIEARRALVGASEVCAGPAPLIARATAALLSGEGAGQLDEPARAERALLLATQLRLGLAWRTFDATWEADLLAGPDADALVPANAFMQRRREDRRAKLDAGSRSLASDVLGDDLPERYVESARASFAAGPGEGAPSALSAVLLLAMEHQSDAALRSPAERRPALALRIADYLQRRNGVARAVCELEREIRRVSGWQVDVPVKLNALVLPPGNSPSWIDAVLGHRLVLPPADEAGLRLANHHRAFDTSLAGSCDARR